MRRWEGRRGRSGVHGVDWGWWWVSFRLLSWWCCRDEAGNGFDALHHVLVTVGPLSAVTLDGFNKTDLFPRVTFVTLDHPPALALDHRFLLLHLLLPELAIAECGMRPAGKDQRELA